ncbi:hypothetical protein HID58_076299 [Brassica napus]|uniref:Uncharacterized protein n=1 Tax=Brassica napus TaxID=3708 RepID=A0ABQ7YNU2_BRANA|nr:hypothetical protein HID58_076299 [Brassica napus]
MEARRSQITGIVEEVDELPKKGRSIMITWSINNSSITSLTSEEARRRAVGMRIVVWCGTRR